MLTLKKNLKQNMCTGHVSLFLRHSNATFCWHSNNETKKMQRQKRVGLSSISREEKEAECRLALVGEFAEWLQLRLFSATAPTQPRMNEEERERETSRTEPNRRVNAVGRRRAICDPAAGGCSALHCVCRGGERSGSCFFFTRRIDCDS